MLHDLIQAGMGGILDDVMFAVVGILVCALVVAGIFLIHSVVSPNRFDKFGDRTYSKKF